jgi:hypothetical protein
MRERERERERDVDEDETTEGMRKTTGDSYLYGRLSVLTK